MVGYGSSLDAVKGLVVGTKIRGSLLVPDGLIRYLLPVIQFLNSVAQLLKPEAAIPPRMAALLCLAGGLGAAPLRRRSADERRRVVEETSDGLEGLCLDRISVRCAPNPIGSSPGSAGEAVKL